MLEVDVDKWYYGIVKWIKETAHVFAFMFVIIAAWELLKYISS